jgi:O6-methylguanine-DNA--protein-cysteine methyltransferase
MLPTFLTSLNINSLAIKLAITISVIVVIASFAFYKGKQYGASECEVRFKEFETNLANQRAEAEKQYNEQLLQEIEKNKAISKQLRDFVNRNNALRKELSNRVEKEIDKNPVYADCRIPSGGVSTLNEIAERYNRERQENNTK